MSMSMNINVHRPTVQPGETGVYRNGVNDLIINLNDRDTYAGTITLFASDAEWDAIAAAVDAFRASEQPRYTDCNPVFYGAIHDIDMPDEELAHATAWVNCEECHELDLAIDQAPGGLCHNCAWRMAQDARMR